MEIEQGATAGGVMPQKVSPSEWDKIDSTKKCMHCGQETIGRCPECLRFVCWKQNCSGVHEHQCKPIKVEPDKKL